MLCDTHIKARLGVCAPGKGMNSFHADNLEIRFRFNEPDGKHTGLILLIHPNTQAGNEK